MSRSQTPPDAFLPADAVPDEAQQVRVSHARAEELREYIIGLLPAHLTTDVDVVITEHVQTAAVLPATEGALLDGDQTDFDREQARALIDQVDGDYLILITGRPAPADPIGIGDQKTIDRSHQYGLALHETLHILKTAFDGIQTLLTDEVDEQYQSFVHDLINIIEDGAIEHEATEGDDFRDKAGRYLTLVREIHSQTPEDLVAASASSCEFTFGDAVLKALHDRHIHDTGVTDVLLDETDDRITFASDAARESFLDVNDEIEQLNVTAKSLRGDEHTSLHHNDRTASVKRAKATIRFWQETLKPFVDEEADHSRSPQRSSANPDTPDSADQAGESQESGDTSDAGPDTDRSQEQPTPDTDGTETAPSCDPDAASPEPDADPDSDSDTDPYECPDCDKDFDSDHGRRVHYGQQHGDTDELEDKLDTESQSADSSPTSDDSEQGTADESPSIDPDDLTLEPNTVDTPFQDVEEHPSIDDEVDPEDVELEPQSDPGGEPPQQASPDQNLPNESESPTTDQDSPTPDSGDDSPQSDPEPAECPDQQPQEPQHDESDPDDGPATTAEGTASDGADTDSDTSPDHDESASPTAEVDTDSSAAELASHADQSASDSTGSQTTFGDFGGSSDADSTTDPSASDSQDATTDESSSDPTPEERSPADEGTTDPTDAGENDPDSDPASDEGNASEASQAEDEQPDPTGADTSSASTNDSRDHPEQADTSSQSAATGDDTTPEEADTDATPAASDPNASTSETDSSDSPDPSDPDGKPTVASGDTSSDTDSESESPAPGPAHDDTELSPNDFQTDQKRAEETAAEVTPDTDDLARELQSIDEALGDEDEATPDNEGGGNDAGPGSISDLTILPEPGDGSSPDTEWDSVEEAADHVADTLAKQLRLDQQTGVRNGLSAGTTVNAKTAYRLGHNDPRTFTADLPGDEKEYFIVLVLDRSGSMGPNYRSSAGTAKIDVATSAVARFATACEDLDIDVAIIDFYDNEARLAKPASVDTEYASDTLLATDATGGTPLSDALSLARSVAQMDAKESIIISITDDIPDDVAAVSREVKASYPPICSLTIATDRAPGNPPAKAQQLEREYDQTATVFDPENLDDRLDEFASLLGAY